MEKSSALHSGFCSIFVLSEVLKGAIMFEISADSPYFGDYLDELAESGIWSDDDDFWPDYDED